MGDSGVDESTIEALKRRAEGKPAGVIVDGFLLFAEGMRAVRDTFDVKLFLRTDYRTAKTRREARSGYVTIDGFWEDPPGYVDQIVWPNYVKDHAFLFEEGNVDGKPKEDVLNELGIKIMPSEAQGSMTTCVQWAYGILEAELDARR